MLLTTHIAHAAIGSSSSFGRCICPPPRIDDVIFASESPLSLHTTPCRTHWSVTRRSDMDMDMDRHTGTHARGLGAPARSLSPHALTLHTHTRSPWGHIARYGTYTVHAHTQQNATVDQTNKLAEQPMRHPPKRRGERRGQSIREGDGRELELGRGRGAGRRRGALTPLGALPAGHVGGVGGSRTRRHRRSTATAMRMNGAKRGQAQDALSSSETGTPPPERLPRSGKRRHGSRR
jgi:hypothetical protein